MNESKRPVLGGQDLREHIVMETMPDGMEDALLKTAQSILEQNQMELAQMELTRMLLDARVISIKSERMDFNRALANARKRVKVLQQIVKELPRPEEKKPATPTTMTAPHGTVSLAFDDEGKAEVVEEEDNG